MCVSSVITVLSLTLMLWTYKWVKLLVSSCGLMCGSNMEDGVHIGNYFVPINTAA